MAQKRYKLSTAVLSTTLMQAGNFRCRVGYEKIVEGTTVRVGQRNMPVLTVAIADVLGTVNEYGQACLEQFGIPQKTRRGGQPFTSGMVFDDVTATTAPEDVTIDLDTQYYPT